MNNSEWGNPNDFFMTFRCMKRKYARPFFKNGRIKFSTPASWVEYARQHGTGRGDHFEGSFATSTPWIWIPLYRYLKSTVGSTQTLSP